MDLMRDIARPTVDRRVLQKDAAAIDRMMTPEYVYIAPNGHVLDKTILGVVQSPTYRLDRATKARRKSSSSRPTPPRSSIIRAERDRFRDGRSKTIFA
jgi:hypothetical protein